MLIIITYDVSTIDPQGQKRLRQIAKACQNVGQRVQNSVFECVVDTTQYAQLKIKLLQIMDPQKDSLRFYRLGNSYKSKVEHYGIKSSLDLDGPIIF